MLLNERRELEAQKSVPHRDFYNVRKVDTHVHHSACMNQKHMLRYIKSKLKHHPNEAVIFRDGRFLTLGEVFKSLNLTAYDLSIDTLDMHANNTFRRFDRFNLKYNPAGTDLLFVSTTFIFLSTLPFTLLGQSRLREIFLKTDNILSGSFLAEITRECMTDLEQSKYTLVEWRISIYGRKASEWSSLSRWFYVNRLAHPNVRWLIQTPRLYSSYKKSGEVQNFGQMLSNIFAPLFAVSIDPASNPPMHYFLQTVVAFDSVDDESRPEAEYMSSKLPAPEDWTSPHNPPYAYWMYYMYANICALNKLRASRGLSTFAFRPHCGEAGDVDHLVSTYLVAHEINHGILLRKNAALQYLYYLSQIGIAMSPLSNNKLFLDYNKNPFPRYFCQGLNVSLSTDDPLMYVASMDPSSILFDWSFFFLNVSIGCISRKMRCWRNIPWLPRSGNSLRPTSVRLHAIPSYNPVGNASLSFISWVRISVISARRTYRSFVSSTVPKRCNMRRITSSSTLSGTNSRRPIALRNLFNCHSSSSLQ